MAKQFLLMVEEHFIPLLKNLVPGLGFLEVQGMGLGGNPTVNLMVTPLRSPVPDAPPMQVPAATQPEASNEATAVAA